MALMDEQDMTTNDELKRYATNLYNRVAWRWGVIPLIFALPGIISLTNISYRTDNPVSALVAFLEIWAGIGVGWIIADIIVNYCRMVALRSLKF